MKLVSRRTSALAALAVVTTFGLGACGDASKEDAPTRGAEETSEAGATKTDSPETGSDSLGLGDYDGLCSWTTPEAMEEVFGGPVDAMGFEECRFVAADDLDVDSNGIYHVALNQHRTMEEITDDLRGNGKSMGFKICDSEESSPSGDIRVTRMVTCPTGSGVEGFDVATSVQLGPGRTLTNQPFVVDSKEEAVAASHRFVEIMTAMAESVEGGPVINEAAPGKWVELYNPSAEPIDVSGYRLRGYDSTASDPDPSREVEIEIEDGATVPAGGYLVVDTKALKPTLSLDDPTVGLWDADGRWLDALWFDYVDANQVIRLKGDAGTVCPFGTTNITKGKANPPASAGCD